MLRGENEISLQYIHCYLPQNKSYEQLTGFQDYLNLHPECANEYAQLKEQLAKQFPDNRSAYTAGKAAFIQMIYDRL